MDEEPASGSLWVKVLAFVFAGILVVGTGFWVLSRPGPLIAEKLWMLGLTLDIGPLRQEAAKALREHPTRDTALVLVTFLNQIATLPLPEDPAKETPEEKTAREQQFREGLPVAEEGLKSLCLITGQDFGVYFKLDRPGGFAWSEVKEKDWPGVLARVNGWAVGEFGPGILINRGLLDFIADLVSDNSGSSAGGGL